MRKISRTGVLWIILFFCLSISASTFAQKELTLSVAIKIALQRNTTLQKATNNLQASESNVKAAYGNFLPNINASGSWSWYHNKQKGGSYSIGGYVINNPPVTSESRSYRAGANWSLDLFDGLSNFATLAQSKNDLESAQLQLENLKQNTVFQTMSLYYTVVNDQQLMHVKEDNLKWNKQNLETITERNKLGAVTLADVYAAQVQEGNAQLDLITAKNNFETSKSNLLYFLGLNVLESYTFSDSLTQQESSILNTNLSTEYQDISQLVDEALSNRSDYKSAKLDFESAENGITIAWSGHLPSLTNSLGYNFNSDQVSDIFKYPTYSIGLTLSVPIFSGFSVENRVEQAEVNAMNKKVDMEDLERQIKQNIQTTYLNLQAAEQGLEVSKNTVKSSDENLKTTQEKYSLGAGTLLDVLTASYNYTNARTNFINAQFEYIVLNEQLKYYLGVLNYGKYEPADTNE
jgi:outer membrane protein